MLKKLTLIYFSILTVLLASSPAKPGVIPSEKVRQYTSIMGADYAQGGLVAKMQGIRESNIQLAKSGDRDSREDVYMSFPVILGSYRDYDDQDTIVSMLQQELFDGPWPSPTMAEHYEEMSYDQFHLSGTVYGWYEMGSNSEFYEGSQTEPYDNGFNGPPGGCGEFLQEALTQSDLEIDFTQYDNDGPDGVPNSGDDDGYVDAAFFVHSGRGGEGGGPYIWSHRWTYSGWWGTYFTTNDIGFSGSPIRVNDYIMQPAVSTGSGMIEIGVFSHEFGHALGLPDLYDTDYSTNGLGSWCLMASGSWSTPSSPVHMSAWCKEMMGWTVPLFPGENIDDMTFPNAAENSYAVKLWTHGELAPFVGNFSHGQDVGREYFLIENRQRTGTEQYLPGTGLLIWHIDNSQWSNSNENHRMVDLMPADGHLNGSSPGDAWPGTMDNRNFDFETFPAAIGWAGVNTEVAVLNISDSDSTMSADIEVHEVNPHLSIADMILHDEDGDQIYGPGEIVEFWLIVENSGGAANNLTATLSADEELVEFIEDVIDFDPIPFMGSSLSNLPFEFIISDSLTPQSVSFDIAFISDEILEPEHVELSLMLGIPDVAIIDDDGIISGTGDYLSFYTNAMILAGEVYAVWDVADFGLPSLEWLQNNSKIIWYTGDNEAPLTNTRIDLMSDYLNAGGNMLLSGQDFSSDNFAIPNFLSAYFAVEVLSDDVTSSYVYGDPEHEMMEAADHFSIANIQAASNQDSPDSYSLLEGGSSLFVYPFAGNATCGATLKTPIYSAVLLGFGMEAFCGFSGNADSVRAAMISRLFTWMDLSPTGIDQNQLLLPGTPGISSAYPNPFNPEINFQVYLMNSEKGQLQISDIRGALVNQIDVHRSGLVTWHPGNEQTAGLYFARLLIDGKTSNSWQKITYLK
ncbi:M6 family metalloprotease domain-containing protein [bacterium]|nr:M6 family metalloprotease domain-containing protein [bacterium]